MVPHCMLKGHNFQCLLGVTVGEFKITDRGSDLGIEGVDAFVGPLAHI